MLIRTGIVTQELIEKRCPPRKARPRTLCHDRVLSGDSLQPCSISCPFHAILPMEDINELPQLVPELCTGCGICAGVCPGLAIFIIDESKEMKKANLDPLRVLTPASKGDVVMAVDREGNPRRGSSDPCGAKQKIPTPLVTLEVSLSKIHGIRFFNRSKMKNILAMTEIQILRQRLSRRMERKIPWRWRMRPLPAAVRASPWAISEA